MENNRGNTGFLTSFILISLFYCFCIWVISASHLYIYADYSIAFILLPAMPIFGLSLGIIAVILKYRWKIDLSEYSKLYVILSLLILVVAIIFGLFIPIPTYAFLILHSHFKHIINEYNYWTIYWTSFIPLFLASLLPVFLMTRSKRLKEKIVFALSFPIFHYFIAILTVDYFFRVVPA